MLQTFQCLWASWDWGTRFSFVAVLVSLATLIGVLAQIIYARRELGFVKADLLQNKRMIDEALKHPELILQYGGGASEHYAQVVSGQDRCVLNLLWLEIFNCGERTAHNLYVELYVPRDVVANPDNHRRVPIDGVDHSVFGEDVQTDPIQAQRTPVRAYRGREVSPVLILFTERQTLRWRIFDDYGIHPAGGYGTLYLDPAPPLP